MAQLTGTTLASWMEGFLKYLGAPAASVDDPRLLFLYSWAQHEGTFGKGNENNPLSINNAEGEPGSLWNSDGIRVFKNPHDGYVALHRYLVNQGITGLLAQLTDPKATVKTLTQALYNADWAGSATPAALQDSHQYALSIGQAAGMSAADATEIGVNSGGSKVPLSSGGLDMGGQAGVGAATSTSGAASTVQPLDSGGAAKSTGADTAVPGATDVNQIAMVGNSGLMNLKPNYTGPGAYKGFDLSAIPSALRQQTIRAINAFTANPAEEKAILNDIVNHYGEMSWVASDPEVLTVLVASSYNSWATKDPATFQSAIIATDWWQKTSDNQRLWQETLANDPGQAQQAILQAEARVQNIANSLGVQLSQQDLTTIATMVAQQSVNANGQYSNNNFTDQQIYEAVAGKFNSTTFLASTQPGYTPPSGTAAGDTGSGDAAALYNAFTTISRNYYLNLTPSQIAAKVQAAIAGDTGQGNFQSGAIADFTTYAQNAAKTAYPALASVIGTTGSTGTDNTPYAALASYRSLIAQYTGYGGDPDTIDLMNPQWSWILSGKPPPTQGAGGIPLTGGLGATGGGSPSAGTGTPVLPSYDQLQRYLMSTPQFQSTDLAKSMGWQVGSSILKAFGYNG